MNDKKILQFPKQRPDVQEMMLDGKPETMLSARGAVLMLLSAWKLDGNEKAHDGLRRYCEYIGVHSYRGEPLRRWKSWTGLERALTLHGLGTHLPNM